MYTGRGEVHAKTQGHKCYSLMRNSVLIILILALSGLLYSQTLQGRLTSRNSSTDESGMPDVMISFLKNDSVVVSVLTDGYGNFSINLPAGKYDLKYGNCMMTGFIMRDINELLSLECCIPVEQNNPTCPNGHKNKDIVEIIYGYPTRDSLKKARKEKVHLGGCVALCEQWYCKIDGLKF